MENKIELTVQEMIELEARITSINIESEAILDWLRMKRIEHKKIQDKKQEISKSVIEYIKDETKKSKERMKKK